MANEYKGGTYIWYGGACQLSLTRVARKADGSIKSGYVFNGDWMLELTDNEMLCKDGSGNIVTRWPIPADLHESKEGFK